MAMARATDPEHDDHGHGEKMTMAMTTMAMMTLAMMTLAMTTVAMTTVAMMIMAKNDDKKESG